MSDRNHSLPREEEDLIQFADVALSGFALLRLSPRAWRSVSQRLIGPVSRLHKLRNTRTRMWRHAIGRRDCREC